MDKNNELLKNIYQDCDMALDSLSVLSKKLNNKDNKIKEVIEKAIKGYEKHLNIVKDYMKKNNFEINSKPLIDKLGAFMGIKMEVLKDNSDSRIAGMLIQGLTMGVINITKNIDKYKAEVDKEIITIAKDYKKHQEESIEKLKAYL